MELNPVLVKEILSNIKVSLWDAVEWIDEAVKSQEPPDEIAERILLVGDLFGKVVNFERYGFDQSLITRVFSALSQLSDSRYEEVARSVAERLGLKIGS